MGHESSQPALTSEEKALNVTLSETTQHCAICANLNGCQFLKSKMPSIPLHKNCHCKTNSISAPTVTVECDIRKFNAYIFSEDIERDQSKKVLFESWDYGIIDSEWLQQEFIRQAEEKYANGNYELGKLNMFGQRISIEITLPRYDGKLPVSFFSGWMIYPNGTITLATPYGGTI